MKSVGTGIVTGVVAAVALLVFLFVVKAGFLLSLLACALFYTGGALFFTMRKKRPEFIAEGFTADDAEKSIAEGRGKVAAIEKTNEHIHSEKVHGQVAEVCRLANDIFDTLEKDPKDLKNARKFLTYYLDTTDLIVSRYAELSANAVYSDDVKASLAKVEDSLSLIQETFKKQIDRLLQDDITDLDIEMELLRKTVKTEGI